MDIINGNLFSALPPAPLPQEAVDALHVSQALRILRIISTGQASPPGFWYDQAEAEWVVLLSGAAGLRLEQEPTARQLRPGDWIYLAPGCRHRVEWTDPEMPTVWLALHFPAATA